jgi:type I restriction enzyme M protein
LARRGRQARQQAAADGNGVSGLLAGGEEHLDISALETWLWDAACAIRGATDAPKFKDFILPLVFFKRLSDVFEDEFAAHVEEYGDEELARSIIEADLAHALKTGSTPIIRFYIPGNYSWRAVRNHGADGRLGEFLTEALREISRLNPDLQGVLDIKDYNERQSGQRTLDDERLASLIEILSRHRLGLQNTEPDILERLMSTSCASSPKGRGSRLESSTLPRRWES